MCGSASPLNTTVKGAYCNVYPLFYPTPTEYQNLQPNGHSLREGFYLDHHLRLVQAVDERPKAQQAREDFARDMPAVRGPGQAEKQRSGGEWQNSRRVRMSDNNLISDLLMYARSGANLDRLYAIARDYGVYSEFVAEVDAREWDDQYRDILKCKFNERKRLALPIVAMRLSDWMVCPNCGPGWFEVVEGHYQCCHCKHCRW